MHYDVSVPFTSGSSLQHAHLYVCTLPLLIVSVPFTSGSSLQQAGVKFDAHYNQTVSVPFTSGSSLQLEEQIKEIEELMGFSSLYIGILAATGIHRAAASLSLVSVPFTSGSSLQRCWRGKSGADMEVSVPFTSGSSLQPLENRIGARTIDVSVPFTSGSSLQQAPPQATRGRFCFSSLYIGILAATINKHGLFGFFPLFVSVPFTSGSSLQLSVVHQRAMEFFVSVPFTSGSSLQRFRCGFRTQLY